MVLPAELGARFSQIVTNKEFYKLAVDRNLFRYDENTVKYIRIYYGNDMINEEMENFKIT